MQRRDTGATASCQARLTLISILSPPPWSLSISWALNLRVCSLLQHLISQLLASLDTRSTSGVSPGPSVITDLVFFGSLHLWAHSRACPGFVPFLWMQKRNKSGAKSAGKSCFKPTEHQWPLFFPRRNLTTSFKGGDTWAPHRNSPLQIQSGCSLCACFVFKVSQWTFTVNFGGGGFYSHFINEKLRLRGIK